MFLPGDDLATVPTVPCDMPHLSSSMTTVVPTQLLHERSPVSPPSLRSPLLSLAFCFLALKSFASLCCRISSCTSSRCAAVNVNCGGRTAGATFAYVGGGPAGGTAGGGPIGAAAAATAGADQTADIIAAAETAGTPEEAGVAVAAAAALYVSGGLAKGSDWCGAFPMCTVNAWVVGVFCCRKPCIIACRCARRVVSSANLLRFAASRCCSLDMVLLAKEGKKKKMKKEGHVRTSPDGTSVKEGDAASHKSYR